MTFAQDINRFNGMYKLPVATKPSLDQLGTTPLDRLINFKKILLEEVDEIDTIIHDLENGNYPPVDSLTDIADLLGDIQVYCASEMAKFGLPLDDILAVIMESNFSKLMPDGSVKYDERGKVMKGPNYWKPEPKIKALLTTMMLGPGHRDAQKLLDAQNKMVETSRQASIPPAPRRPEQEIQVAILLPELSEPKESEVKEEPFVGKGGTFDGGGASGDWESKLVDPVQSSDPVSYTPATSFPDTDNSYSSSSDSGSSGSCDSSSSSSD